jgi:hypothetical protein
VSDTWWRLWPYRAVLAVDARNFSSNTSVRMQQINTSIPRLLAQALTEIGLGTEWEHRQFGQHTGDGYVAGVPPETLPGLIGGFPARLHQQLRDWQHEHPTHTPLQLRVSVHVGPLPVNGLGGPMVHTHRLLDDDQLRTILSRADPHLTTLAMVISQRVYEDVFTSGLATGMTAATHFKQHLVRVKTFAQPAWIHVPGLDWGLADPALFDIPSSEQEPDAPARRDTPPLRAGRITMTSNGPGATWQGQTMDFRGADFRTQQITPTTSIPPAGQS